MPLHEVRQYIEAIKLKKPKQSMGNINDFIITPLSEMNKPAKPVANMAIETAKRKLELRFLLFTFNMKSS